MIYSPYRFLFIHQPRTAGIAVCCAIATVLKEIPDTSIFLSAYPGILRRHARACELVQVLPTWNEIPKFSVVRNPWEVVESNYAYFQKADRGELSEDRTQETQLAACRSRGQSLEEFSIAHYGGWLKPGEGQWKHWCAMPDNEQLGIIPVLFEELHHRWASLCQECGIPECPLLHVNAATRMTATWTTRLDDFVQERFADDIARFGYERPEHVERALA